MNLIEKIKWARRLSKVAGALEEAHMKRKLEPAIFGLAMAMASGVTGAVYSACPDLRGQVVPIALAGAGGAVAMWMLKPDKGAGWKAVASGLGATVVAGIATKVTAICPDLIAQLPQLALSGLAVGIGLYTRSHRQDAGLAQRK